MNHFQQPHQKFILPTKLLIPVKRRRSVHRARLIERIENLTTRKMMLVSAPAGYGKTTIVAEWAAQLDQPIAWFTLDSHDNDLSRFLKNLLLTIQTVEPEIGSEISEAMSIPQPMDPGCIIGSLAVKIASIQPREFYLVLDDAHEIDLPQIYALLELILDNLPPNFHLVLVSRFDPPLPLARLRARDELVELRASDLAFTIPEATEFIRDVIGLEMDWEDIQALTTKTEGWVTGLQLAGIALQTGPDFSNTLREFSRLDRNIADYLTDEVVFHQPPPVRDFLLKTSILDSLESTLCDTVLQWNDSQQILEEIERRNLFLIPLDNHRHWYRYHPLFRALLNNLLLKDHLAELPDLHRRASGWYLANRIINLAVQHAFSAHDPDEAGRIIVENAEDIASQNELSLMQEWLNSLPGPTFLSYPTLKIYQAWVAVLSGLLKDGERYLRDAENVLTNCRSEAPPEHWGMFYAIQGILTRMSGENTQAVELSEKALKLLPSDNLNWQAVALITIGIACYHAGQITRSGQAFSQAIAYSSIANNKLTGVVSAAQYARLLIAEGQLRLAARTCYKALEFCNIEGTRRFSQAARAYTSLAKIYREWNRLEQAGEYLDKAMEISLAYQSYRNYIEASLERSRWLYACGNAAEAVSLLEQVAYQIHEYGLGEFQGEAQSLRARMEICRGRLEFAERWAEQRRLSADAPIDYPTEEEHMTFVRLLLTRSQTKAALGLLDRLGKATLASGRKGRWMEVQVLKALALVQSGKPGRAYPVLQRILPDAEREGFARLFIDEGAAMGSLLQQYLKAGNAEYAHFHPFVRSLLDSLSAETPAEFPPNRPLSEILTAKEIEVIHLLADGSTRAEIAKIMVITVNTVDTHIKNIYAKLGVRNKVEALRSANDLGFFVS